MRGAHIFSLVLSTRGDHVYNLTSSIAFQATTMMMMMIRACSISQPILNGNFFNVEIIEDSLHAMCRYCLFLLVYITIIRKQRSFFSGFLF